MGKIVCEVCGAAYPETSSRCPVCGSVCYSTPEPITDVVTPEQEEPRTDAVRNTRANVAKRRRKTKKNAQLVQYIAVGCALLLLLVLLFTLLLSSCNSEPEVKPTTPTTVPTEPPTQEPTDLPCTGVTLDVAEITLTELGAISRLIVTCEPEDTTDFISFVSSDPLVVTVNEDGELVAVGVGTAQITVTCGNMSAVCEVSCVWEEATEEPTLPPETLLLNRSDFTLSYKGATWQLYDGVIDVSLITFTSDNEKVATIKEGKVTAVGGGMTTVHAVFGEQKVSCIVRCSFKNDTTTDGNGSVEEDNGTVGATSIAIYSQYGKVPTSANGNGDVSIKVGDKVQLFLRDSNNNKITVSWTLSKDGVVTVDGTAITGDATGTVTLTASYQGKEYKCIIRVSQ